MYVLIAILFSTGLYAQKGSISVTVKGLRSDQGRCLVYLYTSKEGFPMNPDKAFKNEQGLVQNGNCKVIFSDLSADVYAVSVIHDENNNGKTDTNFLGIPKEGLGSSNNPKTIGPPRFDDSRFEFKGDDKEVQININYLLK